MSSSGFERRLEKIEQRLSRRLRPYEPPDHEPSPVPQPGEYPGFDDFCARMIELGYPPDGVQEEDNGPAGGS
jgi:hypothetical protein